MLTIQRLDAKSVQPFLLMTAAGLRRSLLEGQGDPTQIILVATFWGQPAGAAVPNKSKI